MTNDEKDIKADTLMTRIMISCVIILYAIYFMNIAAEKLF